MKKIKLLTSIAVVSTAITPLTIITSCGNKNPYQNILANLNKSAINEFKQLSKYPRRTGHTKHVYEYLKQKIASLGYIVNEDNYKAETIESNGNIWFDVPATSGFENKPKIALQGHMDMVLAGKDDDAIEYAKTNGIEVEQTTINGKEVLISKDRKTSLGADDGIGLGLIFALIQSDKVKHGPLKIIITTDEEGGMKGACNFGKGVEGGPEKILQDVDGLVNIDDEIEDEIIISSAGSQRSYFSIKNCETDNIPDDANCFQIEISGLKGGHSGDYINDNRCNANKIASNILSKIDDGTLQLISFSNPGLTSTNVIVSSAKFSFATKLEKEFIQKLCDNTKKYVIDYHPKDNDVDIKISTINKPQKACTNRLSSSIYNLIEKLLYGVYTMRSDKKTLPESSQNISMTSLDLSKDGINDAQFNLTTMARSSDPDKLSTIQKLNHNAYLATINKLQLDSNYSCDEQTHGWVGKETDKMFKYAKKGIETAGGKPIIVDIHSGIECSEFVQFKKDLNLTSIGPRVDDAHSVNETLYLDSLSKTISTLLYIMEHYE